MNAMQKTTRALSFLSVLALLAPLAVSQSLAQGQLPKGNLNVRMKQNEDGTITEFRRSADQRVLERRTYGDRKRGAKDRVLRMTIIYRKDKLGILRSGRIFDGKGVLLYRVIYGYHVRTGRLVAEQMFDARVSRTVPITDAQGVTKNVEKPVRRLYHRYDAQGRRAKPIIITTIPGKKAEELFGKNGTSYVDDPFK